MCLLFKEGSYLKDLEETSCTWDFARKDLEEAQKDIKDEVIWKCVWNKESEELERYPRERVRKSTTKYQRW